MFSSTCAFEVMTRIMCFAHPAAIVKRRFYFRPFAARAQRTRARLRQRLRRPVHRPEGSPELDSTPQVAAYKSIGGRLRLYAGGVSIRCASQPGAVFCARHAQNFKFHPQVECLTLLFHIRGAALASVVKDNSALHVLITVRPLLEKDS